MRISTRSIYFAYLIACDPLVKRAQRMYGRTCNATVENYGVAVKISKKLAFVTLSLIGASLIPLPPASATDYFQYTFTYNAPYYSSTDSVGTFSAQSSFGSVGIPVAFSLTIAPAVQALATGNMTCAAYQFKNGQPTNVTDYHPNVPVSYFWHWSTPNNQYGPTYEESADCYFPVKGGQAHVGAVLTYWISDAGTGSPISSTSVPRSGGAVTLTVTSGSH